jgi:hypothetical protein
MSPKHALKNLLPADSKPYLQTQDPRLHPNNFVNYGDVNLDLRCKKIQQGFL